jgi:hypothetical protein
MGEPAPKSFGDLLLVAGIFVAGLIYYYAFIRPRGNRYWNLQVNPQLELQKLQTPVSVESPTR